MDAVLYLGSWNFDLLGYSRPDRYVAPRHLSHPFHNRLRRLFRQAGQRLLPQCAGYLQGKRLAGTKDQNCLQSSRVRPRSKQEQYGRGCNICVRKARTADISHRFATSVL